MTTADEAGGQPADSQPIEPTPPDSAQDALAPPLPDLSTDPMAPMPPVRPGPESVEPPLYPPESPSEIDLDWAPTPEERLSQAPTPDPLTPDQP